MIHSLQSNPRHHQTSGDSGCSSCGAEAVGAALVLESFLFLLYFPVRLYFPLVPDNQSETSGQGREVKLPFFRFAGFAGGTCIFRKSLSMGEHN